jgi:anti-sigma-K factor RskA
MTSHDDVYPYAVHALPAEEAAQFEAHLADCERCQAELTSLRGLTAELSAAVASAPPPQVRAAVLDAIEGLPQGLRRTDGPPPPRVAVPQQPHSAEDDRTAELVPPRSAHPRSLPVVLAAAAVVAALAFGGWAWHARQVAEQAAEQATGRTAALTRLLSAPDVKIVTGKVTTNGATARVVMSATQHRAMFLATGLPKLPPGKVYEAWTIRGKPLPAGTFSADEAKTTVALPPRAIGAKTVAVTVEPVGGSRTPTSTPIIAVTMPRPA